MKVACITTVATTSIAEAVGELRKKGVEVELRLFYPNEIDEELLAEDEFGEQLRESDVVLIDVRGGGRTEETLCRVLEGTKQMVITFIGSSMLMSLTKLGSFSMGRFARRMEVSQVMENPETMWKKIQRIQKIIETSGKILPLKYLRDARNYMKLMKYWSYGGKENYRNMFLLLAQYLGVEAEKPQDPIEFGEYGIYHPDYGYFTDLREFIHKTPFDQSKPRIGVLCYGGMHLDQNIPTIKALMNELGEFTFIPVYTDGFHNLRAMREYFSLEGKTAVDCVIALWWFRLNGGPLGGDPKPTVKLLNELNVPLFCPAPMLMGEVKKWEESPQGLSPIEIICAVVWPELDGMIEPIPCCGLREVEVEGIGCREVAPIEDRVKHITGRVRNWVRLKNTPNSQKRVAIIVYGYPPGEASIGKAAYLDTFNSVERLLERLKGEGFGIKLPQKPLHQLFEEHHMVNSGEWLGKEGMLENCFSVPVKQYLSLFDDLPLQSKEEVIQSWGEPPGEIMTCNGNILIPGIELGNCFVGLQPARPPLGKEDVVRAAHDKTKPPHHQYIAFYKWLEEVWKADAIIHVGTHGLAEFMKGKEVGMSQNCFPDILIGEMPHLYIYHVINTSESTIAKRRLYGTMIDYNSPPYTTSDVYEDYVGLEDLIHEFGEAKSVDPIRAKRVEEKILNKAKELNFKGDEVDKIHDELYEMKRSIIPKGLHILGEEYSRQDLKEFVEFLLRYDRGEIKSLPRIIAASRGIDYDGMVGDKKLRAMVLGEIEASCGEIVECSLKSGVKQAVKESEVKGGYQKDLAKTLEFGLRVVKDYADNGAELQNIVRGLDFEFIEPALGGDVIRSPEVLPTGRNLYQFDPNKVPTETAVERGREIAENTLKYHLKGKGRYPESTGIILWGFETTKTQGETIGQILDYLGVKIARKYGDWSPQIEVIPLEELGRPRIDCLIQICGFFREMFPNLMRLMDKAFNIVADLDEPAEMNFVRKHSLENWEELNNQGLSPQVARKVANARIFGPPPSEYGTRMLPLVEDSVWEKEEDLAQAYIGSMCYLHAENIHAKEADKIYRKNLANVDLVSQVRDSHDYEVTDLDHYYEFFGGMAKSVEMVKGEKPEMVVSDTTKEVIETEFVADAINRGVRTRLLNPKWIDGMLKHDFHGAQHIADRVENLLGLAATTNVVENWVWSGVAQRYVFDEEMWRRLMENNHWAAKEIAERLLETERRGYWQATEEEIGKLKQAYLEIEEWIEGRCG